MQAAWILTVLLPVVLIGQGCASPETTGTDELPEVSLPLANDPTDAVDLEEWWSDGGRLLRLERSGQYVLHETINRYRQPMEVGRWHRTSYAALWLEPYDETSTRRVRVTIERPDDGDVTLTTVSGEVFRPISAPPIVLEDRLLGAWSGDEGRLLLRPDRRYWFDPSGGGARMASVAGHIGRWSLERDQLRLEPEAGVVASWTLAVDESGAAILLRSPQSSFVHED